jgi:hypothetical protein
MKQTFAVRYNRLSGRTGHIWGDRYWSAILEGEPPEEAGWEEEPPEEAGWEEEQETGTEPKAGVRDGDRPPYGEKTIFTRFSPLSPQFCPSPPPEAAKIPVLPAFFYSSHQR